MPDEQSLSFIGAYTTREFVPLYAPQRTDGTLFRGRYKAINIEASSYLLEVSRYIHRNPVETSKPMVKELELYRWSSYPAHYKGQSL